MRYITEELLEKFSEKLVDDEKSPATVKKYVRDAEDFCMRMGRKGVDKYAVLEYKEYLIERYAPASVNSKLSSLNSFFEFNEWYELRVKTLKIQRRLFADKELELTKSEYERLLTAARESDDERLFLLIQTICSCGLRVSEVRFVTLEAVKKRQAKIRCKGKIRQIFLPDGLCRMLLKYAKSCGVRSGAVFVTRGGKPLDRSNIWKMLKGLCAEAGVQRDKVFPHNLRHLFARTFYSAQKDIVRLADILGHSSVNTTRIYTMETGEVHRRQIQNLGLLRF